MEKNQTLAGRYKALYKETMDIQYLTVLTVISIIIFAQKVVYHNFLANKQFFGLIRIKKSHSLWIDIKLYMKKQRIFNI